VQPAFHIAMLIMVRIGHVPLSRIGERRPSELKILPFPQNLGFAALACSKLVEVVTSHFFKRLFYPEVLSAPQRDHLYQLCQSTHSV
jgi:hypothetical protein